MPDFTQPPLSDLVDLAARQAPVIVQILVIVVVAWVILRLSDQAIRRVVQTLVERQIGDDAEVEGPAGELTAAEARKRIETIDALATSTLKILVILIAGAMILEALSISVAPAVAGLGIVGVAVGFGAQHLVRDYLNGVLILLENQFRRGDVVKIAGVVGLVEEFSLRRTTLRDLDGIVYVVPNGEITVASNLTRGFGRVNENVLVGYGTDVEQAAELIRQVGLDMAADPAWSARILEPPQLERVEALADNGIELKILATVGPGDRWAVAGELRKRLLTVFAGAGVEIPFPHRVVISRAEPPASADGQDPEASSPDGEEGAEGAVAAGAAMVAIDAADAGQDSD
jgi:small conductance mechanosensitive channel